MEIDCGSWCEWCSLIISWILLLGWFNIHVLTKGVLAATYDVFGWFQKKTFLLCCWRSGYPVASQGIFRVVFLRQVTSCITSAFRIPATWSTETTAPRHHPWWVVPRDLVSHHTNQAVWAGEAWDAPRCLSSEIISTRRCVKEDSRQTNDSFWNYSFLRDQRSIWIYIVFLTGDVWDDAKMIIMMMMTTRFLVDFTVTLKE